MAPPSHQLSTEALRTLRLLAWLQFGRPTTEAEEMQVLEELIAAEYHRRTTPTPAAKVKPRSRH